MELAIENLIKVYEKLLEDHRHPIDQTTKEYNHMCGGDARLKRVVADLKNILKEYRTINEAEDVKLYQE